MKTLIHDAITAIATIPELKWVDDNLGQLDEENPPVEYPCALVGIGNSRPTDYQTNPQYGDLTLEVTIVCPSPQSTANPPEKIHPYAGMIYEIIQKTDHLLRQMEGESYSPLNRIGIRADTSRLPARFILSYSVLLYE